MPTYQYYRNADSGFFYRRHNITQATEYYSPTERYWKNAAGYASDYPNMIELPLAVFEVWFKEEFGAFDSETI